MVRIYTKTEDEPVLRAMSKDIPASDVGSEKVQRMITDMKSALATQDDGVAICAPQIGVNLRAFVVSGRILADIAGKGGEGMPSFPDRVFLNPEIVKISKKAEWMDEGCLSLRYLYGKVRRATKVRVRALDEHGKSFELGGADLLAQIFQHEIDHLNGILFTDTAKDIVDLPPEKEER